MVKRNNIELDKKEENSKSNDDLKNFDFEMLNNTESESQKNTKKKNKYLDIKIIKFSN
jgi:hypothetical protein